MLRVSSDFQKLKNNKTMRPQMFLSFGNPMKPSHSFLKCYVKHHVLMFSTSGQRQVTMFRTCAVTSQKECHVPSCRHQASDVCCLRCLLSSQVPIYTPGWREALREFNKCLASKTQHNIPSQGSNPDRPLRSQAH